MPLGNKHLYVYGTEYFALGGTLLTENSPIQAWTANQQVK